MDFGDGFGILSSEGTTNSALRDLRSSSDPNGVNSIVLVYRYIRKAWNLRRCFKKTGWKLLVYTHVTNATSGILTTFPLPTDSSCSSTILPSLPGTTGGLNGLA